MGKIKSENCKMYLAIENASEQRYTVHNFEGVRVWKTKILKELEMKLLSI